MVARIQDRQYDEVKKNMYLKTSKPTLNNDSDDCAKIMMYIENLKEEISFNLEALSKKTENIKTVIKTLSGGEA